MCKKYKNNPIQVAGDFNLLDIDWTTNTTTGNQYSHDLNRLFLELFESTKLCQCVNFNTRKKSTLDLLLTNRPSFVTLCDKMPGFGDHDTSVLADIICHPKKIKPIQRKVYLWKNANITQLSKDIEEGMKSYCSSYSTETPIQTLWEKFKHIILNAQTNNVPTKLTSKRFNQPWFNRECKIAVRKKYRKFIIYKISKQDEDLKKYKEACLLYTSPSPRDGLLSRMPSSA